MTFHRFSMEFHEFWTMKLNFRGRTMKNHGFPFPNSHALLGNEIPYVPRKAACEHIVQLTSASVCDYSEFPEGNSRLGRLHLLLFRSSRLALGIGPRSTGDKLSTIAISRVLRTQNFGGEAGPGLLRRSFFCRVNAVLRRVA